MDELYQKIVRTQEAISTSYSESLSLLEKEKEKSKHHYKAEKDHYDADFENFSMIVKQAVDKLKVIIKDQYHLQNINQYQILNESKQEINHELENALDKEAENNEEDRFDVVSEELKEHKQELFDLLDIGRHKKYEKLSREQKFSILIQDGILATEMFKVCKVRLNRSKECPDGYDLVQKKCLRKCQASQVSMKEYSRDRLNTFNEVSALKTRVYFERSPKDFKCREVCKDGNG